MQRSFCHSTHSTDQLYSLNCIQNWTDCARMRAWLCLAHGQNLPIIRFLQNFFAKTYCSRCVYYYYSCQFLLMACSIQLSSHHYETLQRVTGLTNLDERRQILKIAVLELPELLYRKSVITFLLIKLSLSALEYRFIDNKSNKPARETDGFCRI
jgi:hypothetical protein